MKERNQNNKEISPHIQALHKLATEIKEGLENAGVQGVNIEHSELKPGEVAYVKHPKIGGSGTNTITVELTENK